MTPFGLLLALGMLLTGTMNTLSTKAADQMTAVDRYGNTTLFNHPFLQAAGMFIGEFLCLLVFYVLVWRASATSTKMERAKPFNPLIFVLPALCDMTATSTMYVGLALTDASIFQMLRGSVIIFTSALSVIFLGRKMWAHNYLGLVLVISGTVLVGMQSRVCTAGADGATCPAAAASTGLSMSSIGNILIIVAQLIVAVQMVVEEKFITGYNVPALQVVGLEGLFGFCMLSCVLVAMYFAPPPAFLVPACLQVNGATIDTPDEYKHRFEDSVDGFTMLGHNPLILLALVGNICSIAFFNYFGVSVTKYMSASSRMVLDSLRTVLIWGFSLGVKWESFCWIQIIGFILLITGTVIYEAVLRVPGLTYPPPKDAAASADGGALLLDDDLAKLAASDSEDMAAGLLEAGSING